MRKLIAQQSGMTVIEVLIAAVIFMVGFSTLILLMNSTLVKFSAKELLQADNLAHEMMIRSLADHDTTLLDSTILRSKGAYRVTRQAIVSDGLAAISIVVYRDRQDRKIIELYNAFIIREQ
jgi:Tfp pilus assembly protein PilV